MKTCQTKKVIFPKLELDRHASKWGRAAAAGFFNEPLDSGMEGTPGEVPGTNSLEESLVPPGAPVGFTNNLLIHSSKKNNFSKFVHPGGVGISTLQSESIIEVDRVAALQTSAAAVLDAGGTFHELTFTKSGLMAQSDSEFSSCKTTGAELRASSHSCGYGPWIQNEI